jgi:dynein heavy chain
LNVEEVVVGLINTYLEKLPEDFNLMDIRSKTKERPPDIIVCIQECERMNLLLSEIRTSLVELHMGLSGALNITEAMERL